MICVISLEILKNQLEQEYATFVHVIFCLFSNEMIHIPVQIYFFVLIGSHRLYSLCMSDYISTIPLVTNYAIIIFFYHMYW